MGDGEIIPWKLCVPKHLCIRVLQENHSDVLAAHLEICKTTERICNSYYWPGISRDVQKHLLECIVLSKV